MIRNYIKIAWRGIKKDRFFSFLNIIGLGFGIASSVLIIQYLRGEWSVDKHHTDYTQIYQVNTGFNFGEGEEMFTMAPSPLATKLVTDYPEVENATRLLLPPGVNKYLLKKDETSFFEPKGIYADNTFFSMFDYPFIEGTAKNALQNPNDIVISETLAKKFFNGESSIGKTIIISTLWGDMDCNISGVVKTNVYKTHLDVELFINMKSGAIGNRFADLDEWAGNNLYYTYLKLKENTNPASLEKKFPALIEETAGERLRNLGFTKAHYLLPLKDVYLKSEGKKNLGHQGNITFFYIFAAIGIFILVIACINFMNLSTARSSLRVKEVAIKKVIGVEKSSLAVQFFIETLVFVILSLLVAIFFIALGQWYLENQLGLQLTGFSLNDWQLGLWLISILAFTTILSGSYPALMLSSFSPMSLFNNRIGNHFSATQIRKVLVVVQFVVSIVLIQGILVISEQLKFIKNEDLGYSKSEKIVIPLNTQNTSRNALNLKHRLQELAFIENAGITSTHPGIRSVEDMLVYGEQRSADKNMRIELNWADPDFIATMGFEIIEGRNFRVGDSSYAIVTESALAGLGYTLDNVLNKEVKWNWDGEESRQIIGVIKDYHSASFKNSMQPQMFLLNDSDTHGFVLASLNTKDVSRSVSDAETLWKSINPSEPFEYYFMDEKVQNAYESDSKMSSLIIVFTLLAILISCLGLVGLSAFSADRRKKELGIRKVLGASVSSVIQILSKEFIILVLVAIVVATPIAWYYTREWLNTFHYRIDMPWYAFVWAGFIAILICLITVSFQSIRAAITNPIKSLRTE